MYFLVTIIEKMQASGAKLPFASVAAVLPGRTEKALRGAWDKMRVEAERFATANGINTANSTDGGGNGDASVPSTPGPKKRKRGAASSKSFLSLFSSLFVYSGSSDTDTLMCSSRRSQARRQSGCPCRRRYQRG